MPDQTPIATVLQCHKCQKRLKYTGKKTSITCPACGESLLIRQKTQSNGFEESELSEALNYDRTSTFNPSVKKNRSSKTGYLLLMSCMGTCAFLAWIAWMQFPGSSEVIDFKKPEAIRLAGEPAQVQIDAPFSFAPSVLSGKFYGNHGAIETHIQTKNSTSVPIEAVVYCLEVVQENRQVPLLKKFTRVYIPGGIEPNEIKSIRANIATSIFPDEPGEKTGRYLRGSLVAYVPFEREIVRIDDAVSCRLKYFDAYDEPQNSVGNGDNNASATNPFEYSIREMMK